MKVLILAAGMGTRMKSKKPKVMHEIMGKPMLNWVIDTSKELTNDIAVVLGHGIDKVRTILNDDVEIFEQKQTLGTGHAVMSAEEFLTGEELLILYGDVPLISLKTLKNLISKHRKEKNDATLLTVDLENPYGYGRVVRNKDEFEKIVEHRDADEKQLKIKEINSGIAIYNITSLRKALKQINSNNSQGEYYLTDAFLYFKKVGIFKTDNKYEVSGVNNRVQLSELSYIARKEILNNLMLNGVTILDPESTYIDKEVKIGFDTVIMPQTYIFGDTTIGEDCCIGPMTRINCCKIGDNVKVLRSECEKAEIFNNVSVGPYSRIREKSIIEDNVKIGNFVETKKTKVSKNSKAQHLSYLGDACIGENVNIGAGTITCNYDGKNKFKTNIGKNSFVGSNTSLVAPVNVGENSIIAAGSVITEDIPDSTLAFGRARQINKVGKLEKEREKGE
ncbi:bifunctional UDP-N-acetylglucosamine diphosphorylase/glucosamine-1-phosphate N-acetyltransferase GlmU [Oceanotoga sp. DSM 15011]|jgi:bifunctional UDP-N-acetylglucosamine pyrophosphorylase/glucosamine-1-phosphate N-acetyltransferase|uniref:Bifunctional protein GlmU n=1 Tax=Oceanotoga teriensis TaxID=515440 RepID=A0AA45HJ39_9BACT|nr:MULTISPECIES: bifunctional UDP-N-acetylglucosamine diphosphorylase/glucosamine-1-phosphate N-acetyltransferase GlmU [Oceanotoga]MDN5341268.1 bifunctional UDP-N-acetylglucosamine pyrophosphorylase / glucosamine-phosphate N-acetyltransferase [Oceanotoga sp.]PWJ95693.1 bifunctional UDP-N-acetylglucosamine pyrophosphorylase/glucosamine-1-phosphate N-acetyltransferase [Oceanotoga teriensis]UYO99527.1 bifunctional UDP-N-acetylglucosamine diphosphorylase/glucosamine-1-phosphate N-acetyltransferase G